MCVFVFIFLSHFAVALSFLPFHLYIARVRSNSKSAQMRTKHRDTSPCNLNRVVGFNIRLSFRLSELMHYMREEKKKKKIPCRIRYSIRCSFCFFFSRARFIILLLSFSLFVHMWNEYISRYRCIYTNHLVLLLIRIFRKCIHNHGLCRWCFFDFCLHHIICHVTLFLFL